MRNPQPIIQNIQSNHRRRYRLVEDFIIEVGGDWSIRIHAGYEYDMSSIPRAAQLFISDTEDANLAAPSLIHDSLYSSAGTLSRIGYFIFKGKIKYPRIYTKAEADHLFYDLVHRYTNISNWKINCMYYAVRCFGKGNFQ